MKEKGQIFKDRDREQLYDYYRNLGYDHNNTEFFS